MKRFSDVQEGLKNVVMGSIHVMSGACQESKEWATNTDNATLPLDPWATKSDIWVSEQQFVETSTKKLSQSAASNCDDTNSSDKEGSESQPSWGGEKDVTKLPGDIAKYLKQGPTTYWETISSKEVFRRVANVDGPTIKVVSISDTHGKHLSPLMPSIPDGDILIHSGDMTMRGEPSQIKATVQWMAALPHKVKIMIAGNHDLTLDKEYFEHKYISRGQKWPEGEDSDTLAQYIRDQGIVYLNDQEHVVEIDGKRVKIWGSPVQPEFCDWAFNRERGPDIQRHWDMIPSDTDILVTHGPPLGRGDLCSSKNRAGCYSLLKTIKERVRPKLHVFGHIHEGYGCSMDENATVYCNASTCSFHYRPIQPPIVVDVPL